jgi:hypothetical protein
VADARPALFSRGELIVIASTDLVLGSSQDPSQVLSEQPVSVRPIATVAVVSDPQVWCLAPSKNVLDPAPPGGAIVV